MTDKEKYEALVAEIEHQKKETSIGLNEWENGEEHGRMDVINALQEKIKSMQGEPVSDELGKVVEEIVDPTVLNAYGVKEIANRLRRTMIESVSEEQVKESLISKHDNKTCKENGNSLTQEPPSEDLEKEVYEHLWKGRMGTDVSKPIYFSYDELLEVARHFAAWQKQQMMNNAITAEYWDNSLMLDAEMRGKYSDGNKVKLVIIKED